MVKLRELQCTVVYAGAVAPFPLLLSLSTEVYWLLDVRLFVRPQVLIRAPSLLAAKTASLHSKVDVLSEHLAYDAARQLVINYSSVRFTLFHLLRLQQFLFCLQLSQRLDAQYWDRYYLSCPCTSSIVHTF